VAAFVVAGSVLVESWEVISGVVVSSPVFLLCLWFFLYSFLEDSSFALSPSALASPSFPVAAVPASTLSYTSTQDKINTPCF